MSRYTFTFKKDDIYVEFTTEDKEVIERQFQIWVMNADEYVRGMDKGYAKGQTVNSLNNNVKPKTVTQPKLEIPPVSQQVNQADLTQNPYQNHYQTQQPQQSNIEQSAALLKTINSLQHPQEQSYVQEPAQQQFQQAPLQQQTQNQYYQQPVEQSYQQPQYTEPLTNINAPQNFESVLEKKIEVPAFEPQQNVDQIFLNLINSKNTKDKFHYLMITAYYLTEFGKQERFTLKQINSKLMQNVGDVIDHSMLQEAINQGFIELVPDPTGLAQVGEYRLTRQGEEFFAYRI